MTPMQILKPQFNEFKDLLPSSFKELALNNSEDRTHVSYWDGERSVNNSQDNH